MKTYPLFVVCALILALIASGCGGSEPEAKDGGPDGAADLDGDTDSDADGDGDSDSDGDTDSNTDSSCGQSDFELSRTEVDMLIVLDRSNSMCKPVDTDVDTEVDTDYETLWSRMSDALVKVTSETSSQINFGLMVFPSTSCSGSGLSQCQSPTGSSANVQINSQNAVDKIAEAVGDEGVMCCGGTPAASALEAAKTYLDSVNDSLKRYVLLATDGAPNCNSELDGNSCTCTSSTTLCSSPSANLLCLDDDRANIAAKSLNDAGYPTYVIGVGDSLAWQTVMDKIASEGGTTQYYPAEDTDQLRNAFEDIVGEIITCEFDIDWESLDDFASKDKGLVNFYGDSKVILYSKGCADKAGWDWVDDDTVKFCTDACSSLKEGEWEKVTATFGCKTMVVM